MTRRDMISGVLAATPALAGLRLQPEGVVVEECKVLILSIHESIADCAILDRESVERHVARAFTAAKLPVPQVVILHGLRIEGMAK